jgi:isoaspartyl peptidase/L-asparaginase-like protein (Ntn-hydrolase superfamily)
VLFPAPSLEKGGNVFDGASNTTAEGGCAPHSTGRIPRSDFHGAGCFINPQAGMPALRFCCKFAGFVIRVFTVTALLLKKAFLTAATKQNKLRLLNCGCCAL